MAVASFVLGLLGLIFCFVPCIGWIVGLPLAGLGLLFGAIGLKNPKKGLAIAGLVLSIIAGLIGLWWAFATTEAVKETDKILREADTSLSSLGAELDKAFQDLEKAGKDLEKAGKELEKEWSKF